MAAARHRNDSGLSGLRISDERIAPAGVYHIVTTADDEDHVRYRRLAQLCLDLLSDAPDSETRVTLLKIAQIYMRLAGEPGAEPRLARQQLQQQIQPKKPAAEVLMT
jgi:hypothetical protein